VANVEMNEVSNYGQKDKNGQNKDWQQISTTKHCSLEYCNCVLFFKNSFDNVLISFAVHSTA